MIARGDMGVEVPDEEVPVIQKMIIRKVYEAGKQVITATQMLDSMMKILDRPEQRQQTSPMPSTMEQVPSCFRERRLQGNIRWKP